MDEYSAFEPVFSAEAEYEVPASDPRLDSVLLVAIAKALRLRPSYTGTGLCDWQLKRVTRHIDEHISQQLLVSDLAAIAGLSPSHFSRAFTARAGLTPHRYIMQQRILHAHRLMLASTQSLAEIALRCGLSNQAHLSRMFSRETGMPPGRWRQQATGKSRAFRLRDSAPAGDFAVSHTSI